MEFDAELFKKSSIFWSPAQDGDTPGSLIPGEDEERPQVELEAAYEAEMMREEFLGC